LGSHLLFSLYIYNTAVVFDPSGLVIARLVVVVIVVVVVVVVVCEIEK
jgi:hypothetical protein